MQPTKISLVRVMVVMSAGMSLLLVAMGAPGRGSGMIAAQRSPGMNSGQSISRPAPESPTLGQGAAPVVLDRGVTRQEEQERDRQMSDERHKRLAADVDRMVALSNELKTDLDKTGKDELSLDVIKKAQQIEKLAHDVQSRAK